MSFEIELAVVRESLKNAGKEALKDVEVLVLCGCLEGKKYQDIAENAGYSDNHVRSVGSKLWKNLSEAFARPVSRSNIESAIREEEQRIYGEKEPVSASLAQIPKPKSTTYNLDWGDAIELPIFYGREAEIEQLSDWIKRDGCRLIGILGMGGMGKTTFAIKLAENVQSNFELLMWRSLRNAPRPEIVITEILQFVSRQPELGTGWSLKAKIAEIIQYFKKYKCLLIIDNLEAVLQERERSGRYLEGYEAYGELLQSIGTASHQSCSIFTSREQPANIVVQESEISPIRLFRLRGLNVEPVRQLFGSKGRFTASDNDWEYIVNHYGGNPLALKILASVLRDLNGGNISKAIPFLKNSFIFDDILDVLKRQFDRLSEKELIVMYWLAILGEPVELHQISDNVIYQTYATDLANPLLSLRRRSLIEQASLSINQESTATYFQQPAIAEYALKELVEKVTEEIISGNVNLLVSHSLMQAQAKEYIRETQARFILQPLSEKLLSYFKSSKSLTQHIKRLLAKLRRDRDRTSGYAPGNLLNLLNYLNIDLTGYNFSELSVWQAYLAGATLRRVNFSNADLSKSIFSETLDGVWSVAFSPDGDRIATGDINCDVRIWDVKAAKQEQILKGHSGWVTGVSFSPVGKIVASCGGDKTIKLWDLNTSQCFRTLEGHRGWVGAIDFSSDGKTIVSCGVDCAVRIWDVDSGNCLRILEGHTDWVRAVAYSPDGKTIASGSNDCTIKIWDAETGECLATLEEHTEQVRALTFTPNGSALISGSNDRIIKVWDLNSYQCIHSFSGHTGHIRSLSCDRSGKLVASGSEDLTVRIWDLELKTCWKVFAGQQSPVWSVAFSPKEPILASGTLDRKLRLWDVEAGKCIKVWQGQKNSFWSISYSADSKMLAAGCADGSVKIWDLTAKRCIKSLTGHGHWVWCVAFSPLRGNRLQSKLIASSSFDRTVRIWNFQTGQCLQCLQGHTTYVYAVSFSHDARYVASGSADGILKVWDATSGQCLRTWESSNGAIWCVAFSLDDRLVLAGYDNGTIGLWEIETNEPYQTWQEHSTRVRCLSVAGTESGSSWLVASASDDRTAKVWDACGGNSRRTLKVNTDQVLSVSFSPDCQRLVTGSDCPPVAQVWDLATGNCLQTLEGHESWVYAVRFAPNGKAIATGSQDGTVKLWHPETGELLHNLESIKPYDKMNITGAKGLSAAQRSNSIELGAVE